MGITLKEIVYDIGGGFSSGKKFKAVQVGGPAGGCISEKELATALDYDSLSSIGAILGSGGIVVVDDTACMIDMAKYFMTFTKTESCGKCTPCREGTTRMYEILDKITKGLGTKRDLELLRLLAMFVKENSLCGLGQNSSNPILSTLNKFYDEYLEHVDHKRCPSHSCKNLLAYTILNNCVGCGHCARVCPVQCISGRLKERHIIDQNRK